MQKFLFLFDILFMEEVSGSRELRRETGKENNKEQT